MTRYRIVTDRYAGYEVQKWRWYFPFWVKAEGINTHSTIERAEQYAKSCSKKVVKNLGAL